MLSLALILNRLPGVIGMPQLMLPPGILQRSAGALEIVLLAVIGMAVLVTARRAQVALRPVIGPGRHGTGRGLTPHSAGASPLPSQDQGP